MSTADRNLEPGDAEPAASVEPLISIRFLNGADGVATFTYHPDYSISISGRLWPRQLRAIDTMVQTYKSCTKEDTNHG